MKKLLSLILAVVMTMGMSATAFAAQVESDFTYNVVVNGNKVSYTSNDAINVDGTTMFTAESFVGKFTDAGLTAGKVSASGSGFDYNGKKYYSVRDVANANGLNVFWDSASSTAIVINKDKYDKIKSLIEASNAQSESMRKVEMEMMGTIIMALSADGEKMDMTMPLDASFKIDMDAPFMEMYLKTTIENEEMNVILFDDGKNSYVHEGTSDTWFKTVSSMSEGLSMADQLNSLNPSTSALAEDLSFSALKLTNEGENIVLEGDMYVSKIFEDMNFNELMEEAMNTTGVDSDVSLNYNLPKTMYVKYVMDQQGNIKAMDMKFAMGMSMDVMGESADINISVDLSVPTYIINGDFSPVVPKEIVEQAVDLDAMMAE